MTPRRWLPIGIAAFVIAQALVWLFAGSIWWSFRGGIIWSGGPSPSRVARDSYVAIAFFAVAGITLAALLRFLARPGRRSVFLLSVIQVVNALAALTFTLTIDTAWILITALAVPTLALLYLSERRRSAHSASTPT